MASQATFATYTPTVGNDGFALGALWSPGTLLLIPNSTLGGVYFTGLPVTGNQTAVVYYDLVLNFTKLDTVAGTLSVYVVPQAGPAPFSGTNLPVVPTQPPVATIAMAAAQTYTTVLDIAAMGGNAYRRAGFAGAVGFVLSWASGGNTNLQTIEGDPTGATAPQLLTDSLASQTKAYRPSNIDSGRSGWQGANSRLFRCHKSGFVRPVDDLREDGYLKGLLVLPELFDEAEPPKRPPTPERPSRR